jgi:hypothetical protein
MHTDTGSNTPAPSLWELLANKLSAHPELLAVARLQWGADTRYAGLILQPARERFTLYPRERAGVRIAQMKFRALNPITVAADVRRLHLKSRRRSWSLLTSAATMLMERADVEPNVFVPANP